MAQTGLRFNLFGFNAQGDLGGVTTYTNQRGRLVIFPRSPPLRPPTSGQRAMRALFSSAGFVWRQMRPEQRRAWCEIAKRAKLRMAGFALYVYYLRTQDEPTIKSLERLTGIKAL